MFKEISSELMSIVSNDPIEKIAHMPSKEIAKTLELLFNVKFENVERIYTDRMTNCTRYVVVYKSDEIKFAHDTCWVNGVSSHITVIPSNAISITDNNAKTICKTIIKYISTRIYLLSCLNPLVNENTIANKICLISIPVITCDIMKKLYGGAALPTIIYNELIETLPAFKKTMTVEGIESILELLDELTIDILLDNSFIYSIKDSDKYPGIWSVKKE